MEDVKLGDKVLLRETMSYDTIWTVLYIDGEKLYCTYHNENEDRYESITVHKSLVKKDKLSK